MLDIILAQVTLEIWGAFLTLIASGAAYLSRGDEPKRSILISKMMFIDAVLLLSDAFAWIYNGNTTLLGIIATRICNFFVFALIPILSYNVVLYFTELLQTKRTGLYLFWIRACQAVTALDLAVITVSQFSDFLYYFDENNVYHRSSGYFIAAVLGFLILLIFASMVFVHRRELPVSERIAFFGFILMPGVANLIQLFYYGLSLNNISLTISLFMIYQVGVIGRANRVVKHKDELMQKESAITEHKLRLSQKETELAQARLMISVSQMQPHFIFNALGSIEQLCRINPERAAEATHYFARYLRSNLTALSSKEQIRFTEELNHIRAYIWLEKMRFGDDVQYVEDIEADNFQIPALSIQPLVENSIKHGMMGKEDGVLEVKLITREELDGYVIEVVDNGCGFDPDRVSHDNLTHIGLVNVEDRIQMMTHGSMIVNTRLNEGTAITIRIPK